MYKIFVITLAINIQIYIASSKTLDLSVFKNQVNLHNTTHVENEFISKSFIPFYLEKSLSSKLPQDISHSCKIHLTQWSEELLKFISNPLNGSETWAVQMIDAWAKIPDGILNGHLVNLGDFDECLEIDLKGQFKGQYCMAVLIPTNLDQKTGKAVSPEEMLEMIKDLETVPMLFPQTAICIPSTCSAEDIQLYIEFIFRDILSILYPFKGTCVIDNGRTLESRAIVMICILSLLGGICMLGTILDLALESKNNSNSDNLDQNQLPKHGLGVQLILAFSLYTNTKKWLSTGQGSDNLGCIHGIRLLSMCWVVLGHTWGNWLQMPAWNSFDLKKLHESHWTMNTIFNGTLCVDTFFTLSGLLVAYNLLKGLDKVQGRLNLPMFYIHRYLRLTPMYALILGFMATLLPYMANGPQQQLIESNSLYCQKNWWHNLLYINNLVDYNEKLACEAETWYIANDMQFYIISPLLIYPLWKWRKFGLGFLGLCTIIAIIIPAIITEKYNLLPMSTLLQGDFATFMKKSYTKPWTRIGPYLIGIWTGYLLYTWRTKKMLISRIYIIIGWTLCTTIALSVLYGPWKFNDVSYEISTIERISYSGLHRTVWGICIGWIIFACIKGYGGLVNRFLSWKAFIPLGRLTFAVYLVSYEIQAVMAVTKGKHSQNYTVFNSVGNFFSELVLSLLIGFICTITMESPFMQLEKILLPKS